MTDGSIGDRTTELAATPEPRPGRPHPMPAAGQGSDRRAIRRLQPLLALMLIIAVTGGLWPRAKLQPLTFFDQTFYIGIAQDLVQYGRFTNGYGFAPEDGGEPRPSGMRFTPLYPVLLAVLARVDAPFEQAMACVVDSRGKDPGCPRSAVAARAMQFLLLALFYWLVWGIARRVARASRVGSGRIGWVALGLALVTAPDLLGYVNYLMTEILALTLSTAAIAAALRGLVPRASGRWLACAGALAGLAALTRPAFLYLFLAASVSGLAVVALHRRRAGFVRWGAFTVAGLLVVAPWILRNAVVLHDPHLTAGYAPQVFVQRLAFDQMSWGEYGRSLLCWLPDGNGMGDALFGPGACHRFQWEDQPDNFYVIGNGPLLNQALAASGGWPRMLDYMLHTYVYPDALKFTMVTLSLALRGAWIGRYWGLLFMPVCLVLTCRALWRREAPFLVASLPAWFMLVFTAALSVNQPRYNLMLIPPYALAGAAAIEAALRRACRPRVLPANKA